MCKSFKYVVLKPFYAVTVTKLVNVVLPIHKFSLKTSFCTGSIELKYFHATNKLFFCVFFYLNIFFLRNLFAYEYSNLLKCLSLIYFRFKFIQLQLFFKFIIINNYHYIVKHCVNQSLDWFHVYYKFFSFQEYVLLG